MRGREYSTERARSERFETYTHCWGGEGRLDTAEELYTNKRAPKGVCWKFRYYAQVETTIEVWMDEADGGGE